MQLILRILRRAFGILNGWLKFLKDSMFGKNQFIKKYY